MRSRKWKVPERLALACLVAMWAVPPAHGGSIVEHDTKLSSHRRKIETIEGEIKALLEHKHHENDPKKMPEIVKSLGDKHKELETTSKEYEEERLHVRFKHPDKNETIERKYLRYKLKTLAEMEDELGLDGKLNRLKARVLTTFPPVSKTRPTSEGAHRSPSSTNGGESAKADDGDVSHESVKLVK